MRFKENALSVKETDFEDPSAGIIRIRFKGYILRPDITSNHPVM